MVPLQGFAEYQELRRTARAQWGAATVSNCYLLPAQVKEALAGRLLSRIDVADEATVLLLRRAQYYQCYVFARQDACLAGALDELDLPCVMENPFSTKTLDEPLPAAAQRIQALALAAGFALGRSSHLMLCPADGALSRAGAWPQDELLELGERRFVLGVAGPDDAGQIRQLLDAHFDPLYSYLPDAAELACGLAGGEYLVFRDETGACVALLHHDETASVSTIRQLAVSDSCRGMGMATRLVRGYLQRYADGARRFELWVNDANDIAQKLYTACGYQYAAKRCESYVLV